MIPQTCAQLLHAIVLRFEGDNLRPESEKHLALGTVVRPDVEAQAPRGQELAIERQLSLEAAQLVSFPKCGGAPTALLETSQALGPLV
jgi:hypothetical protein